MYSRLTLVFNTFQELLALRKEFEQQQALLARYSTNPPPLTPAHSLNATTDPFTSIDPSPEGGSSDSRLYESPMQKASEVKFEDQVGSKRAVRESNGDVPALDEEERPMIDETKKEASSEAARERLGEVTKPV